MMRWKAAYGECAAFRFFLRCRNGRFLLISISITYRYVDYYQKLINRAKPFSLCRMDEKEPSVIPYCFVKVELFVTDGNWVTAGGAERFFAGNSAADRHRRFSNCTSRAVERLALLFKEAEAMRKVAVIAAARATCPSPKAIQTLKEYQGIETEVRVLSAQWCPNEREFAASARESRFSCIIALAAWPRYSAGPRDGREYDPLSRHRRAVQRRAKLDGMDALLSTVRMPSGIPVTVTYRRAAAAPSRPWRSERRGSRHKLRAARNETAAVLKAD